MMNSRILLKGIANQKEMIVTLVFPGDARDGAYYHCGHAVNRFLELSKRSRCP